MARGVRIDGVLLLDKPAGVTSNRALQIARRLLNAEKAGHTGTLDPMATGLLPLTFGEATKFSADLLDADKSYRATLKLGVTTTTGDAEGEVTATMPFGADSADTADSADAADDATIDAVLSRLTGSIEQVPPMHSALKRDGRPLYELARAGVEVERAPRRVQIHALRRVQRDADVLVLDVDCSKGTYVRVLAEDIGRALGCGAHLIALRRTRVGRLRLDDAVALAALEAMDAGKRRACLAPVDALVASLPRVDLDQALAERFRLGQRLAMDAQVDALARGQRVRVYAPHDRLLGTANVSEWGVVAPERLMAGTAGSDRITEEATS